MKATELRANLYNILDEVLETGVPVEIERKGRIIRLVPATGSVRTARMIVREDYLNVDPDSLVHLDWSHEWKP